MTRILLLSLAPSQTWAQVLLLILGIFVVLKGADWLTKGAVGLAQHMGVPQIVIGLTIVAIGTSMPELFVSLTSAINGSPDLAVGNVVGSNIFNALLIVGVAAMVAPIAVLPRTVWRDIPIAVCASGILVCTTTGGRISRLDAAILFACFIVFMWGTVRAGLTAPTPDHAPSRLGGNLSHSPSPAGRGDAKPSSDFDGKNAPLAKGEGSGVRLVALVLVGLLCLVVGSNVFVDNASALAHSIGISDAVIGLTIVAGGTSLPELATSVVAAKKGDSGIAIGNVLGSNVFNILMILGITGLVQPMTITGITMVDLTVMVASMILLWLFSFTKYRIERWEGMVLTLIFIGYMAFLIVRS